VCEFRNGEGLRKGAGGNVHVRVEIAEVKVPCNLSSPAEEIQVEIVEDGAFCIMSTSSDAIMF
jgi:hypothetical protein